MLPYLDRSPVFALDEQLNEPGYPPGSPRPARFDPLDYARQGNTVLYQQPLLREVGDVGCGQVLGMMHQRAYVHYHGSLQPAFVATTFPQAESLDRFLCRMTCCGVERESLMNTHWKHSLLSDRWANVGKASHLGPRPRFCFAGSSTPRFFKPASSALGDRVHLLCTDRVGDGCFSARPVRPRPG